MTALPDEFWQGVEQFNQQEFYACHDTLEALWIEAVEPDKKFYQGILQIAVALYHLGNQNWRGAVILLGEGMQRLHGYQPIYANLDMEAFLAQAFQLLTVLQQTGPDRVGFVMQQLGMPLPSNGVAKSLETDNAGVSQESTSTALPEVEPTHHVTLPTLQKVLA